MNMAQDPSMRYRTPAFEYEATRVRFSDGTIWPREMSPAGAEAFVRRWNSLSDEGEPTASVLRDAHT